MGHAEFVTRTGVLCRRAGLDVQRDFNPREARDPLGKWVHLGEDDVKQTFKAPIADIKKLADRERLGNSAGTQVTNDLEKQIRAHGFDQDKALVIDTYAKGDMGLGDGYHRLAAAESAGLTHVPVNVYRNTAAGRLAASKQTIRDSE